MKKLLSLLVAIVMAVSAFAASNCMNYQAVINKADGAPAANANIGMKFTIVSGTQTLFEETATVKSDDKGYVKYAIGSNTNYGLSSVNWENSDIMLQVAIDLNGGTNYTATYSTQIMSVPTALYAETSRRSIDTEDMIKAEVYMLEDQMLANLTYLEAKLTAKDDAVYAELSERMDAMNNETREKLEELQNRTDAYMAEVMSHMYDQEDRINDLKTQMAILETIINNLQAQIDELKSSK